MHSSNPVPDLWATVLSLDSQVKFLAAQQASTFEVWQQICSAVLLRQSCSNNMKDQATKLRLSKLSPFVALPITIC